MPEQNSITKNVKLKSGRQFAKCKALSSRLFLFNQQGGVHRTTVLIKFYVFAKSVDVMEVVYDFVGQNRVLPHGEPPFPIRVDSL